MSKPNLAENYQQTLFEKIKNAFDQQDYINVINLVPKYMEKDKGNAWIYVFFGYALFITNGAKESRLAIEYLSKAIQLNPNIPELYTLHGNVYRDSSEPYQSLRFYNKALELDPNNHFTLYSLGAACISLGETEQGINYLLRAVSKNDSLKYLEDLLQFMYYDPRFKNPDYQKIARLFYTTAQSKFKIKPYEYEASRYQKNKAKIKIGFFCAEGLGTPTWSFLEKVFQKLSTRIEIYCYARPSQQQLQVESQDLRRIKSTVHKWTYCNSLSTKDTALLIHEDELDVLIDLSGYLPSYYGYYSNEPNMLIFMYKPAPVQITWYGFWGTTGISEIDYLITVEDNVPKSQDQYFTEKIYRLPGGYTHTEICSDLPEIEANPPCIKNKYITFASFSRANKLNSEVYDVWSEILKRVPDSKLLFKYYMASEEYMINHIKNNFKDRGIDETRIIIDPRRQRREEFISTYNKVDIGLEPIPFGGITTSINALTMGVPVIAKYEEERVINGGTCSLLKAMGLNELATISNEDYINQAVRLANDIDRLCLYRTTLRDKALTSSINSENYTKDLEQAFIDIWKDCCERKVASYTTSS